MSGSGLLDLPPASPESEVTDLRWCNGGFFFRRTRGLSGLVDFSQVFDSAWLANRAAVRGALVWSDAKPADQPNEDESA